MFWEFLKFKAKEEKPPKGRLFTGPSTPLGTGKSGEDEAVKLLEKKGYKILKVLEHLEKASWL